MARIEVLTPAKINIGLYVVEKRQDGYHNIETIFYPINLYDKIIIKNSGKFGFSSNLRSLQDDSNNLVIRAKNLIEDYSGERLNVKIHLEKNIPLGAGLGGGSSDAAATLNAINDFTNLNLSVKEIFDLGLQLGSDIPFFLNPQPAFATGRGEILDPCSLHLNLPLVIVNPGIHISTKWAYDQIYPQKPNFNLSRIDSLDLDHLRFYNQTVLNVFEKPIFEKYPTIKEIRNLHFKLGAIFSMMSGSGSTVYGIYPDSESAASAGKIMTELNYFVYIQINE